MWAKTVLGSTGSKNMLAITKTNNLENITQAKTMKSPNRENYLP